MGNKMNGTSLKEKDEFQDEIREACIECGTEVLTAYWDDELEYYIYLSDEAEDQDEVICEACQELPVACTIG